MHELVRTDRVLLDDLRTSCLFETLHQALFVGTFDDSGKLREAEPPADDRRRAQDLVTLF